MLPRHQHQHHQARMQILVPCSMMMEQYAHMLSCMKLEVSTSSVQPLATHLHHVLQCILATVSANLCNSRDYRKQISRTCRLHPPTLHPTLPSLLRHLLHLPRRLHPPLTDHRFHRFNLRRRNREPLPSLRTSHQRSKQKMMWISSIRHVARSRSQNRTLLDVHLPHSSVKLKLLSCLPPHARNLGHTPHHLHAHGTYSTMMKPLLNHAQRNVMYLPC